MDYQGYWKNHSVCIDELRGKVLTDIRQVNDDELWFKMLDGEDYVMYHRQDCCESVYIEDITGDLNDLIGSPIVMAEEVVNDTEETDWGTSTWTFYNLATVKGSVTIRWYGESNGYYSESVDFMRINKKEDD